MFISTIYRIEQLKRQRRAAAWAEHDLIVREMVKHIKIGGVEDIVDTCTRNWKFFNQQDIVLMSLDDDSNKAAHLSLSLWHHRPRHLEEILKALQRVYCGDILGENIDKFDKKMLCTSLLETSNIHGQTVMDAAMSLGDSTLQACMQSWPQESVFIEDSISEGAEDHFFREALNDVTKERTELNHGLRKGPANGQPKRL